MALAQVQVAEPRVQSEPKGWGAPQIRGDPVGTVGSRTSVAIQNKFQIKKLIKIEPNFNNEISDKIKVNVASVHWPQQEH